MTVCSVLARYAPACAIESVTARSAAGAGDAVSRNAASASNGAAFACTASIDTTGSTTSTVVSLVTGWFVSAPAGLPKRSRSGFVAGTV